MQTIDIGILLSTEVPTATANSTLLGARHALEEINADPAYPFPAAGPTYQPAGELAAYSEAVSTFIAHGIRHIFGTITSASRKEIIPDRSSITCCCGMAVLTRVRELRAGRISGGCPNQTLLPLLRLALDMFGNRSPADRL